MTESLYNSLDKRLRRVWDRRSFVQLGLMAFHRIFRRYVCQPWSTGIAFLKLKAWGAKIGGRLKVCGAISVYNDGVIHVGKSVSFISGFANPVGADRKMRIWVGSKGVLEIGDECGLSNSTLVCYNHIAIGKNTYIGGGCEIYDTDFHQIDVRDRMTGSTPIPVGDVNIGSFVFIGARSIILKSAKIGDGAVIGAGSVVTGEVPAHEIWAGAPARPIRKLNPAG